MLSRTARSSVDRMWDSAWANGVTNPVAVVEVLTLVLAGAASRSSPLGDGERCWRGSARRLVDAIERADTQAIEQAATELEAHAGLAPGSRAASLLSRNTQLGRDLVRSSASIDHGAERRTGDLLGGVFEHLLSRMATAGHFGQFRTPPHLVDFVVALADPAPGEMVLDPACGTGGFLIGVARRGDGAMRTRSMCTMRGEEIDASVARLAQLNLLVHGLDGAEVVVADGLAETGPADVVVANPPFAGLVRPEVASRFGGVSAKTELLFVEQIMNRLRPGGRAAVVVPWGLVGNRTQGAHAVRRRLVEDNTVIAVIELPAGVFQPYTDSRTAVLVWRAGGRTESVVMARVRADGFSLDDRRVPVDDDDLPAVLAAIASVRAIDGRPGHAVDADHGRSRTVPIDEVIASGHLLAPSRFLGGGNAPNADVRDLDASIAALVDPARALVKAVDAVRSARSATSALSADSGGRGRGSTPGISARTRSEVVPGTIGGLVTFCSSALKAEDIDPAVAYVGLEHLEPVTGRWRWIPAGTASIRSPKTLFEPGDILYGRLRPNLRKCAVADRPGVCSADIFVLRPGDPLADPLAVPLLAHLLALHLRSERFAALAADLATGANLPRLARRDLLAMPFVLPSEPERSRLVSVAASLSHARALVDELDGHLGVVERAVAESVADAVADSDRVASARSGIDPVSRDRSERQYLTGE